MVFYFLRILDKSYNVVNLSSQQQFNFGCCGHNDKIINT